MLEFVQPAEPELLMANVISKQSTLLKTMKLNGDSFKLGSAFQQVINWSLSMTLESIMNGQICVLTWFFPKC